MSSETPSRDRVYQVSSNRESASHKLRYVEGSAQASGECRLCVGSLAQADKSDAPVTVQAATSEDIARIAFFEKQLYDNDAYSSLFFYQALRQWPRGFLTIKSDEKVAGYSLIVPLDGSRATLMSLLIGKSFQGQGLGRILLEQAIKSAAESSWKTLELSVAPDNAAAIKLYKQTGFSVIETIQDYLGPGEDRLIMSRAL
ncbi:GNAT family N-acetyltransferase [Idiomarina sp. UBA4520]|jgi:ribosomal protein S18 acetylase RimI-like enzyme|uniref:GNAT family N-acetyltransferase n=1 Tax=Idiomarina sp. UBA4520 TaxID=1946647 RepID=UPI000A9DFE96|nr:N-acetyltransferase [Idiomarina sp. UBA4520]|tara:strand:+ start:24860 stop:25459 length:600 start_codon:yes stop_codon:yes gene_type:complete